MINKGVKKMEKFLHKQWQDLTSEEQVYFLERKHETEELESPFEDPQSLFVE